jgi:predicted RNA-binding Zn-ribbon protein involved in translation (DUF1610 family)
LKVVNIDQTPAESSLYYFGSPAEAFMAFVLYIDETCPKCRHPIWRTTIELHPSRPDHAVHNFECPNCGSVPTKVISLKPGKPSSSAAA